MDQLLDNAPCGFLIFTDDGKIVEANQTLLNLLGYERSQLLALQIEKIFSVAGRIFFQTHFFPLLKLRGQTEEIYLMLQAQTGANIPVLVNARRRDSDGVAFNDCVFVPMRQRNEYENQILQAKKEAEAAALAKDEFLSVVSHELRTPLNAILGWAQILESDAVDSAMRKKGLETIGRNARIQTQLIEDILDFSRIISGKLRLEIKQINLAEVIEAAVDVVTPAARAKDIRLQTMLDSNGFVSGDPERLQQVLWNLLTNAIKFTPKGGRVQIRLERAGSNAEIVVSDTGQGISAEFLPFVFDRFEQANKTSTRRFGGLGLGMAITRHIVELHGGSVQVMSPGENLGTTFTVRLPITIVHQPNAVESVPTEKLISASENNLSARNGVRLDGINVLVVDDEPDARELLTIVLREQGARVTTAATVSEAVAEFAVSKPDLIISDIEMPDEDGFSLIEKLRIFNENQPRKIPAIAVTARARPAERLKVLTAGYQFHLAKPIETAELLVIVANLIGWTRQQ